jgi:hypothetical protein
MAFARQIAQGQAALVRPSTLLPRPLPCEVARFALDHPFATVDQIFDKTYVRGGGAANRCPVRIAPTVIREPDIEVTGFSRAFLQSAGVAR